ncbi:hypothetical protein ACJIZ3_004976 [Penstemon smallii]|uniref:Cytochrome b-c1 complex subunit 7 n=1 Tax=Penstemon smallii TaxID=265156 RepID=A0ABD3S3S3_9LAMI
MASAIAKWLVDPHRNPLAAIHKKTVSSRLRKFGLRYDDLYDPMYDLDVKEALNRLPREIVDARNQRLKRAMDLSMKHDYLTEDLQAMQTPFRTYLQEMLALKRAVNHLPFSSLQLESNDNATVTNENAEREALGALPLYQRSLP